MPPKKKKKSVPRYSDLTTKHFPDNEINKWKAMEKSTEAFLIGVLDEGISSVTTNIKTDQYSKINDHLMECRIRLVTKWKEMRVPHHTFGTTYKGLQNLNMSYTSSLSEMLEHEEDLERAVEKAEKSCKSMEKELQKREKSLQSEITDLHPLLRPNVSSFLDIPPIPKSVVET
ncbi:uncharacterized protein LOC132552571 [Ylistrum balloti]|uniref:uncharacterized protein LOC132552571 n=1 Tax=Ylistrum balloti TaxID=509963 RepID=UPI00290594A4|nr:uncharacterized protein LOC132552571 [Ylistrum balloti]